MSKLSRTLTLLIAVAMMSSVPCLAQASKAAAVPATTQAAQSSPVDWNTPPAGTEQEQQGYRDGIEAEKLDRLANRKIDPRSSHQYQHLPVKSYYAQLEYRMAFETGYTAAMQHRASY